jgi:hypothetical protein
MADAPANVARTDPRPVDAPCRGGGQLCLERVRQAPTATGQETAPHDARVSSVETPERARRPLATSERGRSRGRRWHAMLDESPVARCCLRTQYGRGHDDPDETVYPHHESWHDGGRRPVRNERTQPLSAGARESAESKARTATNPRRRFHRHRTVGCCGKTQTHPAVAQTAYHCPLISEQQGTAPRAGQPVHDLT